MLKTLIFSVWILPCALVETSPYDTYTEGPTFVVEPPGNVLFSNVSGQRIDCSAQGAPVPSVAWILLDGSDVTNIAQIRHIYPNGSLFFLPFSADKYRQDVHATTYRCIAHNDVGRIISREVSVRAIVSQPYEIQVHDSYVLKGNTALLKCVVPPFVREYVIITSWIQDGNFNIYPSIEGDSKYHLLPDGNLLVHNIQGKDSYRTFQCRTLQQLTGTTTISKPGRIVITDTQSGVAPRFSEQMRKIKINLDRDVAIPCLVQGQPYPHITWMKMHSHHQVAINTREKRIQVVRGTLIIRSVEVENEGTYVCEAKNSFGTGKQEVELSVFKPIEAVLRPQVQTVNLGETAEFFCETDEGNFVTWYKDGRMLTPRMRMQLIGKRILRIESVQKEDKGMYQCLTKNNFNVAQGTAELKMGDAYPQLLFKFINQILRPGPPVSLKCSASGSPAPQILWSLDGYPVPENDRFFISHFVTMHGDVISYLNISSVKVEDGGEFSCTASNRAGWVAHSAKLNIYGKPFVRPFPKVTAVYGEDLVLKCPVAGYPIEEVTWKKDDETLIGNIRKTAYTNGTLVIKMIERKADSGSYTCIARNKQGDSSESTAEVEVIVPPKITPFYTDTNLNIGDSTFIMCAVAKGDAPLKLLWLKDGAPLPSTPISGLSVQSTSMYNSILAIENLKIQHRGNYTCVARNNAAEVTYTQQLLVHVPPSWVIAPEDVKALPGNSVTINCQAEGFPKPEITWKRSKDDVPGSFKDISSFGVKILSNASLQIPSVSKMDEGYYLCQATNGIGSGLSNRITLTLNEPCRFEVKTHEVTRQVGEDATLFCNPLGEKPITFSWTKDESVITQSSHSRRYNIETKEENGSIISRIHIKSVIAVDTGSFICKAENSYGMDELMIRLEVLEPPAPPTGLTVGSITSTKATITWEQSPPIDFSFHNQDYIIDIRKLPELSPVMREEIRVPGSERSYKLNNLKPMGKYVVKISSQNLSGRGAWSGVVEFKTSGDKPSEYPRNVVVQPIDGYQMSVSWSPPVPEGWNGVIWGYRLGWKYYRSGEGYNYTEIYPSDSPSAPVDFTLSELTPDTQYTIAVRAFNEYGEGPLSTPVVVKTLEGRPDSPPENLQCQAISSTQLLLSWRPITEKYRHGSILGYKLFYKSSHADKNFVNIQSLQQKYELHNLKKFTEYKIAISGFTNIGEGPFCEPIKCRTDEDVPDEPEDLKAVTSGTGSIIVSWKEPVNPNGVIVRYSVYIRISEGRTEVNTLLRTIPPSQLYHEESQLYSHQNFEIWITASTRVGEGKSTRVIKKTITKTIPASIYSFSNIIYISWRKSLSLKCLAVGYPIPNRVWYYEAKVVSKLRVSAEGSLILDDLKRDQTGNYTCHVNNVYGSDRINYYLYVQVTPGAPRIRMRAKSATMIRVEWSLEDDGGSEVMGFNINYRRDEAEWEEVAVGNVNTFDLEGLVCGKQYQIYVVGFNQIGSGDYSNILMEKTDGDVPQAPSLLDFTQANSTFVVLYFQAWPETECEMQYFLLEYRKDMDPQWMRVPGYIRHRKPFTLMGLTENITYVLKVTAKNNGGTTTVEYIVKTTTGEQVKADVVGQTLEAVSDKDIDSKLIAAISGSLLAILLTGLAIWVYVRKRYYQQDGREIPVQANNAALENKLNYEKSDKLYVPLPEKPYSAFKTNLSQLVDKNEDICPYATFQIPCKDYVPPPGFGDRNIRSFDYHPTNTAQSITNMCKDETLKSNKHAKLNRSKKPRDLSESDEYDSWRSESEQEYDIGTSSRTESSGHHEDNSNMRHEFGHPTSRQHQQHNFIYQEGVSCTSNEFSPSGMRKSLPNRSKNKRKTRQNVRKSLTTQIPNFPVMAETTLTQSPIQTYNRIEPSSGFSDGGDMSDSEVITQENFKFWFNHRIRP